MNAGVTREMRREVYRRDGWRCAMCDNSQGLQIHHVVPRGRGGVNHPMNLITLCWRCHSAVHGSMVGDEYASAAGCGKRMKPEEVRRAVMEHMDLACIAYVSDYYAEQGRNGIPTMDKGRKPFFCPFFRTAVLGLPFMETSPAGFFCSSCVS